MIRKYLNRIGKRAGNASRSKGRIGSWKLKRAAAKKVRVEKKYKKEVAWNQVDDFLDLENPEDYH